MLYYVILYYIILVCFCCLAAPRGRHAQGRQGALPKRARVRAVRSARKVCNMYSAYHITSYKYVYNAYHICIILLYIYIYTHIYTHTCIYIYRERERGREIKYVVITCGRGRCVRASRRRHVGLWEGRRLRHLGLYAMLCYAMLCYAILYSTMLCYATLYYIITILLLNYTILYYTIL